MRGARQGQDGDRAGAGRDEAVSRHLPDHDWLSPHYQFCNRLAILDFLLSHGVTADVLFVYFTGDRVPRSSAIVCPRTAEEWLPALASVHETVGWPGNGALTSHVHELFLPMHNLEAPAG